MLNVSRKTLPVSVSFTPAGFKSIKKQYQQGIYSGLIAMMKEAVTDSHVNGCLIGRKAGFQAPLNINPYSDDNTDVKRAEWYQDVFDNLNLRQLYKDINENRLFKFSVIEIDWELIDQFHTPVGFEKYDQKYFRYDPKTDYRVLKIDNKTMEDIPEDVLVCETKETPVMLPVVRDFILKEFGVACWASFLETFGEDFILGKYPPGSGKKFKEELKAGLDEIAASSRGIIPDGSEIDLKSSQRSTGDHQKFVEYADTGISITTLGHKNAVESSKGMQVGENLGSYKVKREIAVDDIFDIQSWIQNLIRIIHEKNYGDRRYPKANIQTKTQPDTNQMLKIIDQAYRHGVRINPDHYRDLGLKIYDDQEPLERQLSILGE